MCAIKWGKHHSHDYMLINESFERYREQVTPPLELMEKKLVTITKVLTQFEEIIHQQAADILKLTYGTVTRDCMRLLTRGKMS